MARRLQPTLIDYVVIAINPALIMVLIGSLVYFLLEMFYQGQYPERLHFCLTMFVIAAVLICRISIEEGWERALPFGVILALAICAAMHKFVVYKDPRLAPIGWLINYSIIAITWWFAYKLTWDCTLIDESQDASGEGLLQTAGLDDSDRGVVAGSVERKRASDPQIAQIDTDYESNNLRKSVKSVDKKTMRTAEHSTTSADSILPPETDSGDGKSWWQRFVERRRRPHAPGLWVVYFSLAALPLFGLGQAFIPLSKTGNRRSAFMLLCVYVAAALGLLLTTSFLGLRRYLRQRRLEMPLPMAGTWLVTGAALIGGVLLLTALLPRPNAEYEISELPFAGSEDHDSSRAAVGNEGVRDEQAESGSGKSDKPDDKGSKSDQSEHKSGSSGDDKSKADRGQSKSGETKPGRPNSNASKAGDSKSGKQGSSGSKAGDQKSADQKSDDSKSGDSKTDQSKSSDSKDNDSKSADSKSGEKKSDESKSSESKSGESKTDSSKTGNSKSGSGDSSSPPPLRAFPHVPPNIEAIGRGIMGNLVKLAFYLALAGVALWFLIFHWRTLLNWLQGILNVWRDLFALLLGRRPQAEQEAAPAPPRHKSFADYSDPFAAGVAGRYKPVELVRYSFEAFEAWARDNGWPREPDQTVHDFARQIAPHAESLAAPAAALAEIYSQAAYSPRSLPADTLNRLRGFWQALGRADRERVVAVG